MPEYPNPKPRPHPWKRPPEESPTSHSQPSATRHQHPPYVDLDVTTNFTFLTGASHPDELVDRAAELGHVAASMTDHNSMAGVVRAHVAAKEAGIPLVIGTRLRFNTHTADPPLEVLVYPTSRDAYARLCNLLTIGKRRAPKGECHLQISDLSDHHQGLLAVVRPPHEITDDFRHALRLLVDTFDDDRLSIAAWHNCSGDDHAWIRTIDALCRAMRIPMVVTNNIHQHAPERRPLQDVLTCIRHRTTLEDAGFRLAANAERYLKAPEEMYRIFRDYPHALRRTVEIARRATAFSLDELRYNYPDEIVPEGLSPDEHLANLTWQGAARRYPGHEELPSRVRAQIQHELRLIAELNYAPYFLTVHDIVAFARSREILCQGRGAAANSAVCFALGITEVDPDRIDVLFERFVSRERNEPPDIDVDFEHERREEVIQYIYGRFGRHRAALTAEVITYRGRSAVREVGKAFGLSLDLVDRLAKTLDMWSSTMPTVERLREMGLNPEDRTLRLVITLTRQLVGFPRHLSQHVGGFVITRGPLSEIVPIENAAMPDRTVIEWDKDDIDAMGMLKMDVLGLGMLTCIRKTFEMIRAHHGRDLTLATTPAEDPAVYDMVCKADTVGVFQIESRAQMSMLPRLKPRNFYDLVIEVSIVRPGPIVGGMVHPYLRRRNGEEPVTYPNEQVARVLRKTLGVPLFQEQAMKLSMICAGFSADKAERLRRTIAAWKTRGSRIAEMGEQLMEGMIARGYEPKFAEQVFQQVKGFSSYGFPESHAASFALLVYVSAWLKCHYPAAFAAALINSQPMGFYAPAQIVRDAEDHAVVIAPVDVNHSAWNCTLEGDRDNPVIRLGMRLVRGLREVDAERIVNARDRFGPAHSIDSLLRRTGVRNATLRALARADAFTSLKVDRQRALWRIQAIHDEDLPLFDHIDRNDEPDIDEDVELPAFTEPAQVRDDYHNIGLTLREHPIQFVRAHLAGRGVTPNVELADEAAWPAGRFVRVAGLVLVRQRPSTASGVLFITLEDETGIANLIIHPKFYERFRTTIRSSTALVVRGRIERNGIVVHTVVHGIESLDPELGELTSRSRDFH